VRAALRHGRRRAVAARAAAGRDACGAVPRGARARARVRERTPRSGGPMSGRARAAVAGLLALAAGCARSGPLRLVALDCGSPDGARLNQPLVLRFSGPVDPGSVRATSVRVVRARDGAPAEGRFVVDGAIVTFLPRAPCRADRSEEHTS